MSTDNNSMARRVKKSVMEIYKNTSKYLLLIDCFTALDNQDTLSFATNTSAHQIVGRNI